MKKNTTVMKRVREQAKARKKIIQASAQEKLTIGLDMSDQSSCYCVIMHRSHSWQLNART